MSNGVEVIVAGDKTIPGEKDFKRLLTSGAHKPVTLKPSTLTDHMVMLIPQESSNVSCSMINSNSHSFFRKYFRSKTCRRHYIPINSSLKLV